MYQLNGEILSLNRQTYFINHENGTIWTINVQKWSRDYDAYNNQRTYFLTRVVYVLVALSFEITQKWTPYLHEAMC
jgi:hypothetical protein